MTSSHLLVYLSVFAPAIPLAIGISRLKYLRPDRKCLLVLMGVALVVQLIAIIFFQNKWNNHFLYHIYNPIEVLSFLYIYQLWLSGWWKKWVFKMLMGSYLIFAILNTAFSQPFNTNNSNAVLVGSIILIILAIVFFYRILDEMNIERIEKSPQFWINTSILLYFSGSLLIIGLNPIIAEKSVELFKSVWIFHSSFNILHYILFAIGLWIKPKLTHSNS